MKRWSFGTAVLLCLGVTGVAQAAGPPTQLTVGDDARPLIVEGAPLFGWMPERQGNDVQTAYQLTVTKADGTAVWDSGKTASRTSLTCPTAARRSRQRRGVPLEREDWDSGGAESPAASAAFETGIGNTAGRVRTGFAA